MLKFKRHDKQFVADKQQREEDIKKNMDAAMGAAQRCLSDEGFIKYADKYRQVEKDCIVQLMNIDATETDPVQYGFRCKDVIKTMRFLGALLKEVKQDAGRA